MLPALENHDRIQSANWRIGIIANVAAIMNESLPTLSNEMRLTSSKGTNIPILTCLNLPTSLFPHATRERR